MPPFTCRIPSFRTSYYLHRFPIFQPISVVFFSTSTSKVSIYDYLVNRHQFSPKCAADISASSSVMFLAKPQNADSILSFLKETGFSRNQIEAVLRKSPEVLSAKLESSIKPKMKVFRDLGFHSTDIVDIVSVSPWFLHSSCDSLRLSILSLKNALGPNVDICMFLKNSGGGKVLARDLDRTLVPNLQCLKSCGICPSQIVRFVCKYPISFLANQEKFKGYVNRVDEMGVVRDSKMFLYAVQVVSSLSRETWDLKLKLFRDLGFSEQNILQAFRIQPSAFSISERKIKVVTELLLSVENLSISFIAAHPRMLSYSVEKRLKPRLRVFKALESKKLLKKRPSLHKFLLMTDAKFVDKYVSPYSDEVGDLYLANQAS